jgi:hypothetical protein
MRLVRTGGVLAATPSSLTTPSSHGAPSLRAPEAAAVHAGVVEPDLDVAIAGDVVVCGGADGERGRARDRSSNRDDVPASSGCREHVSRAHYAGTRGPSGDWIGTHVGTNCQLHGDFDVQVDYELWIWPAANGVAVS